YFSHINFFKTYEEIEDKTLPTLIVGWEYVKTKFNDLNILNKEIDKKTYWTFSFSERRDDSYNDIEIFINKIPELLFNELSYTNIDPIFEDIKSEKQLIEVLEKINYLTYFNKEKNMLYLLST